jgi:bla regulator protein blaR1
MQTLVYIGQVSWTFLWTPVLTWTVVMSILWIALRAVPGRYPQLHLDVGLAGMLALAFGVLVALMGGLWPEISSPIVSLSNPFPFLSNVTSADLIPADDSVQTNWWFGLGLVTVVALALTLVGILRLIVGHLKLKVLLKDSHAIVRDGIPDGSFFLPTSEPSIQVVASGNVSTAFSTGILKKRIVIPESLDRRDRATVLQHEYNHLVNGDILRAGLSHACKALFYFHPLVHVLHTRTMLLSEIVCDQRTIQYEKMKPRQYVDILMRNAPLDIRRTPALALVHSPSQLRRRIIAMKNNISLPFARSHLLAISSFVLLVVSLVVGCSDVELTPTQADIDPGMRELVMAIPAAPFKANPFVIVEQMPVLIDGLKGIQARIKYPEIAKKAGVQGRVFLQFIVDEEGNVVDPVVTRGIGSGCDEEAVLALKGAKFIPGVQRGRRVRVKMSLPVTFRLDKSL